jgi:hypothetical protein
MISHDEFVLSYENGRAGCSVSASLTLRLFFAGKIREKWVSIRLLFWSLGFLALNAVSGIVFLSSPVLWALLGTIAMLAIYVLAFFYSIGGFVLSAALANEEFYEFAKAKRALWIYADHEEEEDKRSCTGSLCRFDLGFAWFNRRFDIKEHPLRSIGFVAGVCVALGYWLLATIHLSP